MPQAFRYVQARQQIRGFCGACFARHAQIEQRLHHHVKGGDPRDHPQELAHPADRRPTHFQHFARRGLHQIHPFITMTNMNMAFVGQIVGVQRA
ncbi:hypothetical protein D3C78_1757380 [compost metagenome]